MLFNFGWGSGAAVFGIGVFGKHSDALWHKALIWPIYRAGRSIRDAIWWVRYRIDPNHKYHMIDTHLKPGYYDIDHLMLNGMFSLLRRYVEDEHEGVESLEKWGRELLDGGENEFCREANIRQGSKELEAVALYRWWTETRPAMLKRQDELLDSLYGGEPRFVTEPDGEIGGEKIYRNVRIREDTEEEEAQRKELDEMEDKIDREEQEMLHRLIDIRRGLWT